jgi:hypothetical protein
MDAAHPAAERPDRAPLPERGVGMLLSGVLGGLVLVFATRQILVLPAAILAAVALDLWLAWRAGRPLLD